PCFFAITYGAILFVAMTVVEPRPAAAHIRGRLLIAGKLLSLAAIVAICLSASLLLPFIEFLNNASFYKESQTGGNYCYGPLTYLYGMILGQGREAPFMGIVAATFLSLAFVRRARRVFGIAFVCLVAVLMSMPFGWLADVLALKPIHYLATTYGRTEAILLASILAALGFQSMLTDDDGCRRQRFIVLFCSTALTAVAVLLSTWPGLEVGEPAPVGIPALIAAIRQHKQIFTAILAVAIGACALVSMKNK